LLYSPFSSFFLTLASLFLSLAHICFSLCSLLRFKPHDSAKGRDSSLSAQFRPRGSKTSMPQDHYPAFLLLPITSRLPPAYGVSRLLMSESRKEPPPPTVTRLHLPRTSFLPLGSAPPWNFFFLLCCPFPFEEIYYPIPGDLNSTHFSVWLFSLLGSFPPRPPLPSLTH